MNSPVIKPTVGRVLYFYPSANTAEAGFARHANGDGPYTALIAHVWNDGLVNLSVFDANGAAHSRTSVPLWQDPLKEIPQGAFCGWMPYQKGQAAKTDALEKGAAEAHASPQYRQPSQRDQLECALVSGAAAYLATNTPAADCIASSIKKVLDVLHPIDDLHQRIPDSVIVELSDTKIPSIALSVVDPGPDSLERGMESKTYPDGTTAFGSAPLPAVSPAFWAKPLAKEVPELTVSLSDVGLEREIQANAIPPHQQRVLDEKRELDDRLSKLDAFILDNPLYSKLPANERERLDRQSNAMHVYSGILSERIANF